MYEYIKHSKIYQTKILSDHIVNKTIPAYDLYPQGMGWYSSRGV